MSLVERIAEHRAAPAPLRQALWDTAARTSSRSSTRAQIRVGLAKNPLTRPGQLAQLLRDDDSPHLTSTARTVMARADMSADLALSLLGGHPRDAAILAAATRFPGQATTPLVLARLAKDPSTSFAREVASNQALPLMVRTTGAREYVRLHPDSGISAAIFQLCAQALGAARTQTDHAHVGALIADILTLARRTRAHEPLATLDLTWMAPLTAGTPQWLAAHTTTIPQIRTWAGDIAFRWSAALTYRGTGAGHEDLPATAWRATRRPSHALAEDIIASPDTADVVRFAALEALGSEHLSDAGGDLLATEDVDLAVTYATARATRWLDTTALNSVAARPDLSGAHLQVLLRAGNSEEARSLPVHAQWAALLALHPEHTAQHSAQAHAHARRLRATPTTGGTRPSDHLLDLVDAADHNPALPAAAAPVRSLQRHVGIATWARSVAVAAALDELLPTITASAAADALLALLPQFTGTLSELFDVVATITSP